MTTRDRLLDAALQHFANTGEQSITVSTLARLSSVARGTIYNNCSDLEMLFDEVTRRISQQITDSAAERLAEVAMPLERLALFMALLVKRAHDDPHWGRFMVRFAPSTPLLQEIWSELPPREIRECTSQGHMRAFPEGLIYYVRLLAGSTYAFIMLVVEGRKTWRDTARNLIPLALSAGGVDYSDAMRVAEAAVERLAQSAR